MREESSKNEVLLLPACAATSADRRRMSPVVDKPPKPWRRRVFHGGTTGSARGAPYITEIQEIIFPDFKNLIEIEICV